VSPKIRKFSPLKLLWGSGKFNNYENQFLKQQQWRGINLTAEKLPSVWRSGGQNEGHLQTKKIGGEI
jgi:hypothetical protein